VRWPLSLLFRGDRDAPAAAGGAPDGSGTPGAAPQPSGAVGVPARPAAWRSLPPLQRATGGMALTAPAAAFVRELATRRPPDLALRPLAHDVVADGPSGLVSGVATPLTAPRPSSAAVTGRSADLPANRAVQRRATVTSVAAPPARGSVAEADHEPAATSAPPGDAGSQPPGGAGPLAPPRALPLVSSGAASAAFAATRVASSSAPEPVRALAPAGPSVQRSPAPVSDAMRPGTPSDASPAGLDAGDRPADRPAAPSAAELVIGSAAEAAPQPAVQRRTLGESRRLGLGAPLASRPAHLVGAASGLSLPLARAAMPMAPATATTVAPPPRAATAAPAALPVLRPIDPTPSIPSDAPPPADPGPAAGDPGAGSPSMRAAPGGLAESAPAPLQRSADLPLASDPARRPLPGVSAATDDHDAFSGDADGRAAAGAGGLPLAGHRGDDAATSVAGSLPGDHAGPQASISSPGFAGELPSAAGAPGRRASAPPRLVVARRAIGGESVGMAATAAAPSSRSRAPGAGAGVPAAPVAARVAAMTQRADLGALTRLPSSPGATTMHADARALHGPGSGLAGPGSGLAGPETGLARLPVARLAKSGAATAVSTAPEPRITSDLDDGSGPPPDAGGPFAGWTAGAGFAPVPAGAGPIVQRTVEIGEISTTVEAQPAGSTSSGSASGAGGPGAGQDYEEIADRVYDRIRSRFASELLLDRERMGLLIDG
jgi:hypothetical protein